MKLYSILLALAACAVAASARSAQRSSKVADSDHVSIKALFTTVSNAANMAEDNAEAAENALHSARLAVVHPNIDSVKDAEHYANITREAADAAIAASDRATAAANKLAEISKANLSSSSSDAVARALEVAERANQAKTRAIIASKDTNELYDERIHIHRKLEICLSLPLLSMMSSLIYVKERIMNFGRRRGIDIKIVYESQGRYIISRENYMIHPEILPVYLVTAAVFGVLGIGCFGTVSAAFRKRVAAVKAELKASESKPKTISAPLVH